MNPKFMLNLQEFIRAFFLFATGIFFKLVDTSLVILKRIFTVTEQEISFTFSALLCAGASTAFAIIHAFFFAGLNISGWNINDIYYEFVTFVVSAGILIIFFDIPYFGLFHRLGLSGLQKGIIEMNRSFTGDYYKNLSEKDDKYLLELLNALIFFPVHTVLITIFQTIIVALCIAVVYFNRNWDNIQHINYLTYLIIFMGVFEGELILAGYTYILTDYFTGTKRTDIKSILQSRGINCNEQHGLFMLREKFMILLVVVIFTLAVLVINGVIGQMALWQTIAFLIISTIFLAFLLFMYLDSIIITLNQVKDAADDLAKGGRGSLPLIATEHEFSAFSTSFEKASDEVYQIRKNLQKKVEEKTYELRKSLEEVSELKQQQDGDYLLTSFLLDPLAQNTVNSNKIKIDFFIKQKKKFNFKKWDKELGGDICIAHEITLNNKRYIVFVNADAMGKSMQGAGGALVLGATFQSIVDRTRFWGYMQDRYPERWLKNSFIELHRLFRTFDSQMLISMFFGLIDEETGLLYFINAEHPRSVVLRNNSTSYIEKEILFYKLGSPEIGSRINVSTFQMIPGDIIIAGSDGRDDIQLGVDKDGSRIIDPDEKSFLKAVEIGNGNLDKIYDYIITLGDITDDISMLKIEYFENAVRKNELELLPDVKNLWELGRKAYSDSKISTAITLMGKALTLQENNIIILKEIIRLNYKAKNYEKVIIYAEQYLEREDGDPDILYILSVCYKKVNNYDRAMACAVRLRLRIPDMVQNLLNLSELNVLLGTPERIERAKKYCSEALDIEPQNEIAIKIKEHINKLPESLAAEVN